MPILHTPILSAALMAKLTTPSTADGLTSSQPMLCEPGALDIYMPDQVLQPDKNLGLLKSQLLA